MRPPVPSEISDLITLGWWPKDRESTNKQNLQPLVQKSVIQRFAPEEYTIYLLPPPFVRVEDCLINEKSFWRDPRSALHEIDPGKTVIIGDFGLGSDAPIALDYRKNPDYPAVIRLRWSEHGKDNHWVEIAPDVKTFIELITISLIPPSAG
jgi:hypothetical protein